MTEPVDVEDLGGLVAQLLAHLDPVSEIVAHVVAAEGTHSHGITTDHTHSAGGGSGGLGSHSGAYIHTVVPVKALVNQGSGLGAAAAEHHSGDRHAVGVVELLGQAGAVHSGSSEAAVGMSQLAAVGGVLLAVDGNTGPLLSVLGRILVQAFPPHSVVVQVMGNVGEDGALHGGVQSVGVGLLVGAGGNAEEAVFGVDGVQTAVLTNVHPGDIVANGPHFVALLGVDFGRNQHGQVGLAAGRGEGSGDILGLAVGELNAQDQHMLGHPAFLHALVGSDTQSEALLAQQHVAAVTGVDGPNGVLLGELHDVTAFLADVSLGMLAADEIVGLVAQLTQSAQTHAGHDVHVQDNVDGVGNLNANLGEGAAHRTHAVGDDVHGTALHAVGVHGDQLGLHLFGIHPVVDAAGILFVLGADEGTALHAGHVVLGSVMQHTAGQFFLVQLGHLAGGESLLTQSTQLSFGAVDPDHLIGSHQLLHLLDPVQNVFVIG